LIRLVWDGGFSKIDTSDLGGRCLVVLVVFGFSFISTF